MVNYFVRGLRRLFGIKSKPKKKIAPYGSVARPKLVYDFDSGTRTIENVASPSEVKVLGKKSTKKKTTKKKTVKKKSSKNKK